MNENPLRIAETPRTLREIALERVRNAIFELHFKPGARLTERDLGEQLGVSRTVVREVIRHLESEGLVEIIPNQGPIVARLDPATAAEIYELRGLLESAAASEAARLRDPATVDVMREALDRIRAAYAAHDFRGALAAATRFYQAMFEAGGRHVAWEVVQRLNGRISLLRSLTTASPGRETTGPAQLQKILDAIAEGRVEDAGAACREHIAAAASIARAILDRPAGL